jgi:uncharacterized membrane protein
MLDFIVKFLIATLLSIPMTMGLGVIYFVVALTIVDSFKLNYAERPVGYYFMNTALILTFISYFFVFAIAYSRL